VTGRAGTTPPDPPFARGGKRRNEIGMKAQLVQDQLFTSPGPASRGIPGSKDMIKTFLERVLVVLILGGAVRAREESQLANSRSVVECPLEQAPVTSVELSGGVKVLRPAPLIGLVGENVRDNPCPLTAAIPFVGLREISFPPRLGAMERRHCRVHDRDRRENHEANRPARHHVRCLAGSLREVHCSAAWKASEGGRFREVRPCFCLTLDPGWDAVGKASRGRAFVPAHALTEGIGWSRGRFELTGLFLTECRSASDA
jgi:hypothetical protein